MLPSKFISLSLVISSIVAAVTISPVDAAVACTSNEKCEELLYRGSECVDGYCTNPFSSGCLHNVLGSASGDLHSSTSLRVCNSEDSTEDVGIICQPKQEDLDYLEIRLMSQNWETAFFTAWVLQIIMSELLNVPVTIESGMENKNVNFYNKQNSFQYGGNNLWDALRTAKIHNGDCTAVAAAGAQSGNYTACGHAIPEVWTNLFLNEITDLQKEEIIEPVEGLSSSAQIGWFIPKFLADSDPTLLYYKSIRGEKYRSKLAYLFKRPTTWYEYCTEVSKKNCSVPDGVANRFPNENEYTKMFSNGQYTGHFRATADNDCQSNPHNCTGHVADYTCGMLSFAKPQAYHNKIAVKSNGGMQPCGGYSYSQSLEIWRAANATKSNVMMVWYKPDSLYQEFVGTDAEFTRITFPRPTQDCIENRVSINDRNSFDIERQLGDPLGSCEDETQSLTKMLSTTLYETTYGNLKYTSSLSNSKGDAVRSPAYDTIKSFTLSELQVGKILDYWIQRNIDKWNFDGRNATCQWVVENLDHLKTFVPRGYPRTVKNVGQYNQPIFYAAIGMGCISTCAVLLVGVFTYKYQDRKVFRCAQVEFLFLVLLGLLLVSIGSIVLALAPNTTTCVVNEWLLTTGYTLELIPLIVKVAAMNSLMNAAKKFKRVQIQRSHLINTVAGFVVLVIFFNILRTSLDPPSKKIDLIQTNEIDVVVNSGSDYQMDATIVKRYYYCESNNMYWTYLMIIWRSGLLLCATALAYQTRKMQVVFNDSRHLGLMIYSQFFFLILSLITYVVQDTDFLAARSRVRSLLCSVESLFTLLVYFGPKFKVKDTKLSKKTVGFSAISDTQTADRSKRFNLRQSQSLSCDDAPLNEAEVQWLRERRMKTMEGNFKISSSEPVSDRRSSKVFESSLNESSMFNASGISVDLEECSSPSDTSKNMEGSKTFVLEY